MLFLRGCAALPRQSRGAAQGVSPVWSGAPKAGRPPLRYGNVPRKYPISAESVSTDMEVVSTTALPDLSAPLA